ncbi:hypothetical protein JTB14_001983 [Gonioctena quinquepunctata]|nr:hypothetical protein JTB14_001983 [Gonioctena quinquepunctata]
MYNIITNNKQDNKKGQVDNINLEHKKTPDQKKGKQATPKKSCSLPPWTNSHKNISHVYEQKKKVEQTKKGISVKDVSHGIKEVQQDLKAKEYIELEKQHVDISQSLSSIDQEWKTVRPRKLNRRPIDVTVSLWCFQTSNASCIQGGHKYHRARSCKTPKTTLS